MTQPCHIPFAASASWYAAWLRATAAGLPHGEACDIACRATITDPKSMAHATISSHNGDIRLSVAVEGGAKMLKRRGFFTQALLSSHGDWPHVHLGALDAAYGKTPFYPHFIPALREVYEAHKSSLYRFNLLMHETICRFLDIIPVTPPCDATISERGTEIASRIRPEISILDPLMRFGRETILALHTL